MFTEFKDILSTIFERVYANTVNTTKCYRGDSLEDIRKIYTEEKAKVVASVLGEEFIQFLAAQAIFQQEELKNRLICTLFFNSSWCSKELKQFCPPRSSDDLCLLFCLNLSSMVWKHASLSIGWCNFAKKVRKFEKFRMIIIIIVYYFRVLTATKKYINLSQITYFNFCVKADVKYMLILKIGCKSCSPYLSISKKELDGRWNFYFYIYTQTFHIYIDHS